jgi:hypothetical protein
MQAGIEHLTVQRSFFSVIWRIHLIPGPPEFAFCFDALCVFHVPNEPCASHHVVRQCIWAAKNYKIYTKLPRTLTIRSKQLIRNDLRRSIKLPRGAEINDSADWFPFAEASVPN